MGIRKANVSESLMKCRKPICDIETGAYALSRDESGGCPFTGLTVSGVKATRSWSAAAAWNVGRQVPIPAPAGFGVVRGRAPSSRSCEVLSTDAGRAGGPVRSSGEAPVTGVVRPVLPVSDESPPTARQCLPEALGWEEVSSAPGLQTVQPVVDWVGRKTARPVRALEVGPG